MSQYTKNIIKADPRTTSLEKEHPILRKKFQMQAITFCYLKTFHAMFTLYTKLTKPMISYT